MIDNNFDIVNAIDCNNWFARSPQPIFVMRYGDETLTLHRLNRSACELLKCTEDNYHTLSPVGIGLFSSESDYKKYIDAEIGPEGVVYSTQIVPLIEPVISSEITLYKTKSADGFVYLVAFQQNAGNLTKILSALRHSEFRFLMMAENITDGIMIYENGNLTFANSASTQITGFTKEQLKTTSPLSLICDYERERVQKLVAEQQKTNPNFFSTEVWILNRAGQEKCIKCVFSMTKTQVGETISYNVITDITAQKLTERALIKSQEEFKMLADNSPDIITRYNRNLTYAYVNRAAEEITKVPIEKFIGHNIMEIDFESNNVASFIEEMHLEVFRTGRKLKFEFKMNIDGKQHIFQASMVPEMSKDGSVNTVLNVSRDITQIKEFEVELNQEKQKLIESNSNIAANIKLLGVRLLEACPELKNTSLHTSITRIAEWTGIGARLMKLEPTTVDVVMMLTDYHLKRVSDLSQRGIKLELSLPSEAIKIYTDVHVLGIVLDSLLSNAIESENTDTITIGFGTSENKEIVFFVKDNGKGVPADIQEKIFEPFCSIGKDGHSGLGLSTARKCVEHLKGRIWCYSSAGDGAQFFFTHPIGVSQPFEKSNSAKNKWADKKIHVVEDTDANYILIEAMLKLQGITQLTRSVNGQQAIDYLKQHPDTNLVLMDIQLPDYDGYSITRQIRMFNTQVPIIAQTAYAMYADVVKAMEAGCNDFIAKPIKMNKMLSLLEKYL